MHFSHLFTFFYFSLFYFCIFPIFLTRIFRGPHLHIPPPCCPTGWSKWRAPRTKRRGCGKRLHGCLPDRRTHCGNPKVTVYVSTRKIFLCWKWHRPPCHIMNPTNHSIDTYAQRITIPLPPARRADMKMVKFNGSHFFHPRFSEPFFAAMTALIAW